MSKHHGLYKFVTCDTNETIYIGKSNNNLKSRVADHIRGKGIDEKFNAYKGNYKVYVTFLPNTAETDILERALINKYKPILNVTDNYEGMSNLIQVEEPQWIEFDKAFPEPEPDHTPKPVKKKQDLRSKDLCKRKISKDRIFTVQFDGDIDISFLNDAGHVIRFGIYGADKTKTVNFSERLNDIIYDLADSTELTDEDKEAIEDAFNEAGNRFIKDLTSRIEVGDTYCDPQGEYEIIATDGEYVTLKCTDEAGPGWNVGKEYPDMSIYDAVFYIYGYYKDDEGIKYVPDSKRI